MSTSKIHVFRYQPDLPDTVIYWSITFIFFLMSMIGLMEHTGQINLFSVITFIIFLIFGYFGAKRKIIISNEQLKVLGIMKRNGYQIDIEQIEKISVGSHGLTMTTIEGTFTYLMRPKSKNMLIDIIQKEKTFQGVIEGYKKSVDY